MRKDIVVRFFFYVDFLKILRGLRRASDNRSESVETLPKFSEIGDCEVLEPFLFYQYG